MSPPGPVEPSAFRAAMGRWATGVAVLTSHAGGEDAGLTVNALLSVTLEPATVLVSLQREVDTLPVLRRSRRFALSLLAAGQRELSERFARPVPSAGKFAGLRLRRGLGEVALLEGALGSLECRLVSETPSYDHVLVLGEVERLEEGADEAPLVFFRGAYASASEDGRITLGRRTA